MKTNQETPQLLREPVVYFEVMNVDPITTRPTTKHLTWILCLAMAAVLGCKKTPPADDKETASPGHGPSARRFPLADLPTEDKDAVLPGRHLSEHQVADMALKALPPGSNFRCEFKDGEWEIWEVQKGVLGVPSTTTNAEGKIFITSTNVAQVVLRIRDADGKVGPVKTP